MFSALGPDGREGGARLEEDSEAVRLFWRGEPVTCSGRIAFGTSRSPPPALRDFRGIVLAWLVSFHP